MTPPSSLSEDIKKYPEISHIIQNPFHTMPEYKLIIIGEGRLGGGGGGTLGSGA